MKQIVELAEANRCAPQQHHGNLPFRFTITAVRAESAAAAARYSFKTPFILLSTVMENEIFSLISAAYFGGQPARNHRFTPAIFKAGPASPIDGRC